MQTIKSRWVLGSEFLAEIAALDGIVNDYVGMNGNLLPAIWVRDCYGNVRTSKDDKLHLTYKDVVQALSLSEVNEHRKQTLATAAEAFERFGDFVRDVKDDPVADKWP